ncbi:hypothetical protein AYI68_g2003 [Smittium mucronatum]|uniref:Uncharacterized protein n=1 Tax=Smittium mucronatum TaxID=133383 RepID=A0A1R0H3T9_9FUNG|nr:hypothetical protein AYI68_g2003 [Smittium mucronatum]
MALWAINLTAVGSVLLDPLHGLDKDTGASLSACLCVCIVTIAIAEIAHILFAVHVVPILIHFSYLFVLRFRLMGDDVFHREQNPSASPAPCCFGRLYEFG